MMSTSSSIALRSSPFREPPSTLLTFRLARPELTSRPPALRFPSPSCPLTLVPRPPSPPCKFYSMILRSHLSLTLSYQSPFLIDSNFACVEISATMSKYGRLVIFLLITFPLLEAHMHFIFDCRGNWLPVIIYDS